ncbi:MAG: hypothetical protein K6A79_10750 [Ruminococcus sp.]|nr:hypothetical protein [Ruminococcus sp.]
MSVIVPEYFEMTYDELANFFLKKYGGAKYDYFHTPECKSVQKKNLRTNEGLEIHHIDENRYPLLCKSWAAKMPFECQKAERLVYVNLLEHLLLHIKIWEEEFEKSKITEKTPVLGRPGITFISNTINDYFSKDNPPVGWRLNMFRVIEDSYDDFVVLLKYHLKNFSEYALSNRFKTKQDLNNEILSVSKNSKGTVKYKLYKALIQDYSDIFPYFLGDTVCHDTYGTGKVININYDKGSFPVVFIEFNGNERKLIAGTYKGLKKLES